MTNNSDYNQSLSLELFLTIPVDFIRINSDEYIQNIIGSNLYSVELLINYPDISISNSYKSHRNFAEFKELLEKAFKQYDVALRVQANRRKQQKEKEIKAAAEKFCG
jgi:hypothetical protein